MKSREQFEATAADWYGLDPEVIAQARMADGYNMPKLANAWRWWQFAREFQPVTIPVHRMTDSFTDEAIDVAYPIEIVEAFTAVGLEVVCA